MSMKSLFSAAILGVMLSIGMATAQAEAIPLYKYKIVYLGGDWSPNVNYTKGTLVRFSNSLWISKARSRRGFKPDLHPEIWEPLNSFTGAQGPVGPQGPQGIQGAQGVPGQQGLKGDKGDTGSAGPVGPAGPVGATGATGAAGPIGLTGPAGVPGTPGAQGLQGAQGEIGPAGPAGSQGPQGPQGETGPAGAAGVAGPAGPVGASGPQGPAGPAGAPGPAWWPDFVSVKFDPGTFLAGNLLSFTASNQSGLTASSSQISVAQEGAYQVSYQLYARGSGLGDSTVILRNNGVELSGKEAFALGGVGYPYYTAWSDIIQFAAGDVIDLAVKAGSDSVILSTGTLTVLLVKPGP